jgi:hypothetical protein
MDDNGTALAIGLVALVLVLMVDRRLAKLVRDVDCLVDGDTETVKLRRKLEGRDDG